MQKMMTAANNARNLSGTPAAGKKRPRKPYTISRPREKWTADEHDLFLHALLMFGRDWKTIERFVATKTATQIRSHAQKYFLKSHRLGLAAALPPPHPRRSAAVILPQRRSMDWPASCSFPGGGPCWPSHDDSFTATAKGGEKEAPREEAWVADCLSSQHDVTIQLPLSPDDLRFAEVYRFVGDVFGSGAPRPVEAHLQRLHGMDPVVAETVLLVLSNLEANLCA
jgi:SHAQKYF class myb-like DNA-binding protein